MKPMYLDKTGAIVPAAGQGKRMGSKGNKLFLELAGTPVLAFTLSILEKTEQIAEIVIAAAREEIEDVRILTEQFQISKAFIVEGGRERQESVYNAVRSLNKDIKRVVVHDGARPLITSAELNQFLDASEEYQAAVTAVNLKDTVKIVNQEGWVINTPERKNLRIVQTPQVFERNLLEKVHKLALLQGFVGTDDASLFEWQGYPVKVMNGSLENIKITTPEDLILAETIMLRRMEVGSD